MDCWLTVFHANRQLTGIFHAPAPYHLTERQDRVRQSSASVLTNLGDRLVRLERQRRARGVLPGELFQGLARASRRGPQMPPPRRDENGANLLRSRTTDRPPQDLENRSVASG